MAPADSLEKHGAKMVVALLLTFSSGLVDILGYLGVFHFFTAHLTGTTVQLGHNLLSHNWIDVTAALVIVGAFVIGSIVGRLLIEMGSRRKLRRVATITLVIEGILLVAVAELGRQIGDAGQANLFLKPFWSLRPTPPATDRKSVV